MKTFILEDKLKTKNQLSVMGHRSLSEEIRGRSYTLLVSEISFENLHAPMPTELIFELRSEIYQSKTKPSEDEDEDV